MKYISTRGKVKPIGFQQAVLMGLADDGGLLIPEEIPQISKDRLAAWSKLSYGDLAFEIIGLFVDDIPPADLKELINRTYTEKAFGPGPDPAPLVKVGKHYILELWHGPTLAFKDYALQLLGNLFEYILRRTGRRLNILGATSGDTGSAAICGVRGRAGIDIFMMHPSGRTSAIQERQMTTVLDDNVHNIAVDGTFDDCQKIMKELAGDLDFKRRYSLGAVNSVNWARVLAQIVYYFWAYFRCVEQNKGKIKSVRFSVPTGNFGDVLAGWYAMKMGLPINTLILATNENDILFRFFNTGEYSCGKVHQTLSPSMDIQVASNFERYLYYRVGENPEKLRDLMAGFAKTGSLKISPLASGRVDEQIVAGRGETKSVLDTIGKYWKAEKYVLDPHTAVGVSCADAAAKGDPIICLATAHPAKFPNAIEKATGENIARHPAIDKLMNLPTRCENLPNDKQAVRMLIEKNAK